MQLTSVTATASAVQSGTSQGAHSSTVDYNSFLQLLVTQLKNQDPTAPTDSTAFMAQLASFSNVEQSIQINSKFDQLLKLSQLAQADGMIGRVAASTDGLISGLVKSVRVDANGVVATLESGQTLNVASGVILS